VVPHVGDQTPTSSQTSRAKCVSGFPCSESLMGGPRSAFDRWHKTEEVSGRTVTRPSPLNLISYFAKVNQICKL
jgi:hypothetical protein